MARHANRDGGEVLWVPGGEPTAGDGADGQADDGPESGTEKG